MRYTQVRYWQALRWYWIQMQRFKGTGGAPVPIVGVIIDTNNDNVVDVNGDNLAAL
jgi:hypothetical protein